MISAIPDVYRRIIMTGRLRVIIFGVNWIPITNVNQQVPSLIRLELTDILVGSYHWFQMGPRLRKGTLGRWHKLQLLTLLHTHTVGVEYVIVLLMAIRLLGNWIASSAGPDQTARMRRLIWDYVDRKRIKVLFSSGDPNNVLGWSRHFQTKRKEMYCLRATWC